MRVNRQRYVGNAGNSRSLTYLFALTVNIIFNTQHILIVPKPSNGLSYEWFLLSSCDSWPSSFKSSGILISDESWKLPLVTLGPVCWALQGATVVAVPVDDEVGRLWLLSPGFKWRPSWTHISRAFWATISSISWDVCVRIVNYIYCTSTTSATV